MVVYFAVYLDARARRPWRAAEAKETAPGPSCFFSRLSAVRCRVAGRSVSGLCDADQSLHTITHTRTIGNRRDDQLITHAAMMTPASVLVLVVLTRISIQKSDNATDSRTHTTCRVAATRHTGTAGQATTPSWKLRSWMMR